MIRRKVLPVILVVVMAMTALLLTGCNETTLGTSNWTTNGGDPSLTKQEEVADDKLVEFGMYPQTKAAADVQSTIKSNVKIDPETGLWTEFNDEKASARYDLETGYFVYQAKVEGEAQAEQYYMMCGENLYLVEPIKWIVLETSGSESLLISSKILDGGRKYNNLYGECTWAESSMRDWLNGTDDYDINNGANYKEELNFLNRAFNETEIAALKKVSLSCKDNDTYKTDGGEDTQDLVYLPSADEFNKYFTKESGLNSMAYGTNYAEGRGLATDKNKAGIWWLRETGAKTFMLAVDRSGNITEGGYAVSDVSAGVRPIISVSTSALKK
ncbi:MAG: hypothetical protein E7387_01130 [Ruminococcaceae bacterium]|nr:hypothetical protein [Oscillospiraceae bacterium]